VSSAGVEPSALAVVSFMDEASHTGAGGGVTLLGVLESRSGDLTARPSEESRGPGSEATAGVTSAICRGYRATTGGPAIVMPFDRRAR
jgi:hypothetical protein